MKIIVGLAVVLPQNLQNGDLLNCEPSCDDAVGK